MWFSKFNTILNTAPLLIQGTSKLLQIVRDQKKTPPTHHTTPDSTEEIKEALIQVHRRLDDHSATTLGLIEQITEQLRSLTKYLIAFAILAMIAAGIAILTLLLLLATI